MRARLENAGSELSFALFDPTALQSAPDLDRKGLEKECSDGNILLVDTDDLGVSFDLVVDEELDPDLVKRAEKTTENALLRVPSGLLLLTERGEVRSMLRRNVLPRGTRIPPGTYLIDGYDVNTEPPSDYYQSTLGPEGYARWRGGCHLQSAGCAVGILSFVLLAFAGNTEHTALRWVALSLGLLGALVFNWRWTPSQKAARAAYAAAAKAWENKYPSGVVVLKRLPTSADLSSQRGAKLFIST